MCASGNTSSTSFRIKIEATNSVKEVICYNIMGTKSCSQSGLRLSSGRSSFSSWVFKEKMIMQFKFRSRSNVLITPYKMLHEFCLPFFKTVHLKEIWVTYGAYLCKKIKKWIWYYVQVLKYGFHYKSFILNAPLVSCPIPGSNLGLLLYPPRA